MKIEGFKNAFLGCFLTATCAAFIYDESNLVEDQFQTWTPAECHRFTNNSNKIEESDQRNLSAECFAVGDDWENVTCVEGFESRWMYKIHYNVRTLKIFSWPDECLSPLMIFRHFPNVENLHVVNSSSITFSEDFPIHASSLKNLYLNGLTRLTLRKKLFMNLPSLENLNLRENFLTTIDPYIISSPPTLKSVYLLNNRWNCSHEDMHWLAYLNTSSQIIAKSRIYDYDQLTCQGSMYPGKPLHVVMDMLKLLNDECPEECSCILSNLVRNPEGVLVPVVTVDCQNRGLLTMPSNLPSITTILLLQGNNISEIRPLAQNSAYRKITEVYLDNNSLSNVRSLEGSDWMLTFNLLSLRGNNLTKLPVYFFDHAFGNNMNAARVYLGNNPWKCTCYLTPRFQDLLLKYKKLVGDIHDIRCQTKEKSEISGAQVDYQHFIS